MLSHEALKVAIGGCAKPFRETLRKLGKRVSLRWVYYLCEPPADVRRLNPYDAFWLLLRALFIVNRKGFDFLVEDFCARVEALRSAGRPADGDWWALLAVCAREQSEALQAAIRRHDDSAIRRELAESIAAERRLLAMLDARPAAVGRAA